MPYAGSAGISPNLQEILSSNLSQWVSPDKAARAISYINSALSNPPKPTRCGKSLSTALSIIDLVDTLHPNAHISKRAGLRASLYGFLTAERTDEEVRTMMRELARCSCVTASDPVSFHAQASQSKSNFVLEDAQQFVIDAIKEIELLFNPMDSMPVHKGTSKAWPTCMSDLMPFGADQLVFNILQWYRIFPHPTIVRFALLVVKVCGTPVYGAFNRADIMSALFLDNMRQCVDETLTYTTPAQLREFTPMISYIAVNFLRYLPYFAMKMRTPGVIAAHGEPVTKGGEIKAVQICSLILYILGSPHLDPKLCTEDSLATLRTDTMYLASMIFRRYKLDQAPGSPMRLHPAIIAADRIQQRHPLTDDPHNVIATAMYICRFYYICVTPGCKNCFINPDELLRTCSGCSTVRYCGQECQTKDWKEEPYKHKKLCKILSTIMAAFGSWKLAPLGNLNDKPFEDHRVNDLKRRHDLVMNLRGSMLGLTSQNKLSEDDVLLTWEWAKTITDTDIETDQRPIVEWHPGYEDYDELLQRVEKSQLFKAPTGEFYMISNPVSN